MPGFAPSASAAAAALQGRNVIVQSVHPGGAKGVKFSLREVAERTRDGRNDPRLKGWAGRVLIKAGKPKTTKACAQAILDEFRKITMYVPDPVQTEMIAKPATTLCLDELGLCMPASDCDDRTVAIAAALLSLGYDVKIVGQAFNFEPIESHVILAVKDEQGTWLKIDPSHDDWPVGRAAYATKETEIDPMASATTGLAGTSDTPGDFIGIGSLGAHGGGGGHGGGGHGGGGGHARSYAGFVRGRRWWNGSNWYDWDGGSWAYSPCPAGYAYDASGNCLPVVVVQQGLGQAPVTGVRPAPTLITVSDVQLYQAELQARAQRLDTAIPACPAMAGQLSAWQTFRTQANPTLTAPLWNALTPVPGAWGWLQEVEAVLIQYENAAHASCGYVLPIVVAPVPVVGPGGSLVDTNGATAAVASSVGSTVAWVGAIVAAGAAVYVLAPIVKEVVAERAAKRITKRA